MPTNTTAYDIYDKVRLGFTVATSTGGGVNTGVCLIINTPSGGVLGPYSANTTNSTSIGHTATGVWFKDHTTTEAGRYTYEWKSTGSVTLADSGAFAVRPRKATT